MIGKGGGGEGEGEGEGFKVESNGFRWAGTAEIEVVVECLTLSKRPSTALSILAGSGGHQLITSGSRVGRVRWDWGLR